MSEESHGAGKELSCSAHVTAEELTSAVIGMDSLLQHIVNECFRNVRQHAQFPEIKPKFVYGVKVCFIEFDMTAES